MVFTNKKIDFNFVDLQINEHTFERVDSFKFLGLIVDQKLKWHVHINSMCNTISKNIGILYKLNFYSSDILKMIYHTFITPHFNYCIVAWANSNIRDMERLFKLQKKAIRIL